MDRWTNLLYHDNQTETLLVILDADNEFKVREIDGFNSDDDSDLL